MLVPIIMAFSFGIAARRSGRSAILWAIGGAALALLVGLLVGAIAGQVVGRISLDDYPKYLIVTALISIALTLLIGALIARRLGGTQRDSDTSATLTSDGLVLNASGAVALLNQIKEPYVLVRSVPMRLLWVIPAKDLGGKGEPEELTAIHWRPFGGKVQVDVYSRWVIDVGHSPKVPDYRVGTVSSLPLFLNSCLGKNFLNNQKQRETQVRWVDTLYLVAPGALRKDGYLPYPAPKRSFVWNGTDSLLLDFKVPASVLTKGPNGQQVHLMVVSSSQPGSRAVRSGSTTKIVDPFKVAVADRSDNAIHDHQFEFARIQTTALAPWMDSGRAVPNYHKPVMAASIPAGTSLILEYQGARDKEGPGATAFSTDVNKADGSPWIRYRVTFQSNALQHRRASIDTLLIPAR